MNNMSVVKLTEKYYKDRENLKSKFINKVTSILKSKLKKKSALDVGISELNAERAVTLKEIDQIKEVIKESK